MQLWFWAALISMLCSGIGNFIFKIAAHRNYNSELFTLFGALASIVFAVPGILLWGGQPISWPAMLAAFMGGMIAAAGGIIKVYALRYIDTTIFFPLFKLLSPLLAIIFGLIFFAERFSTFEWVGLLIGLTVPLLLITPTEKSRQNNLVAGLILVLLASVISAIVAALNKLSTVWWVDPWWLLLAACLGMLPGVLVVMFYKLGLKSTLATLRRGDCYEALRLTSLRGFVMSIGLLLAFYAFGNGGSLAVVHTILSLYILVPIVLAIIFYQEHWNLQKVFAIGLSIAALIFLH